MFWTEFKHSSCPILAENQGLKNQGGSNRKMFFKFEKHQKKCRVSVNSLPWGFRYRKNKVKTLHISTPFALLSFVDK